MDNFIILSCCEFISSVKPVSNKGKFGVKLMQSLKLGVKSETNEKCKLAHNKGPEPDFSVVVRRMIRRPLSPKCKNVIYNNLNLTGKHCWFGCNAVREIVLFLH